MKRHLDNIEITRRAAIKGLTILTAAAFLPTALFSGNEDEKMTHFIGLGGAGTNAVEFLFKNGVKGKFTCVSYPQRPNLPKEISFIQYASPGKSFFKNGVERLRISDRNQQIEIPDSVLELFNRNERFVLISGLGGVTGTYMTEELTFFLHKSEKSFLTISSYPFQFEGKKKIEIAKKVIDNLSQIPNFKFYKLDTIQQRYGNISLSDAYKMGDKLVFEIYKNNLKV